MKYNWFMKVEVHKLWFWTTPDAGPLMTIVPPLPLPPYTTSSQWLPSSPASNVRTMFGKFFAFSSGELNRYVDVLSMTPDFLLDSRLFSEDLLLDKNFSCDITIQYKHKEAVKFVKPEFCLVLSQHYHSTSPAENIFRVPTTPGQNIFRMVFTFFLLQSRLSHKWYQ